LGNRSVIARSVAAVLFKKDREKKKRKSALGTQFNRLDAFSDFYTNTAPVFIGDLESRMIWIFRLI